MGSSAIPTAIMALDPEDIRAAIVSELVPIIASNVDPQTWDPRELPGVGGNTWQAVIWQEHIWYRDEDSLVDHDELTCIRLLDGIAYLTNDVRFPGFVLSRTTATPPDEIDRAYGDTYRVPSGATDDWAGHEDEDAMWTARGYRFREPVTGDLHYVVDESGYEHYSAEDEWEDGFGTLVFETGLVRPNSLLIRSWAVENDTTTAPPATGPAGEQYIIGPSATGAWSGHDKKLAWRPATDAAFVITTPFTGEEAYNKATSTRLRWTGTAWQAAISGYAQVIEAENLATLNIANNDGSDPFGYVLSSTAPVSTQNDSNFADTLTVSVTADVANQVVEVEYVASVLTALAMTVAGSAITQYSIVAAFYVDSETNARSWQRIFLRKQASGAHDANLLVEFQPRCVGKLTLGDTSAHTIKVRFHLAVVDGSNAAILSNSISLMNRRIMARKRAV